MLRPGVYEHQIVARAQQLLFEMGSEQVEAINAVSGDRCNPHPHVFSDRLLRPGRPGVLRRHPLVHGLPHVLLPDVQRRRRLAVAARRVQAVPRVARRSDRARAARARHRRDRRRVADRGGARLLERGELLRPPVRPRRRRRPLRAADDLARPLVRVPGGARGGHGLRARDVLRRERRPLGREDRGGGRRHEGREPHPHALPRRGAARRRARRTCAAPTCSTARRRRRPYDAAPARPARGRRARAGVAGAERGPRRGPCSSAATPAPRTPGSRSSRSRTATSTRTSTRSSRASTSSAGEPVLYLDGRGVRLEPDACGAIPVGVPHAWRERRARASGSRWPRPARAVPTSRRTRSCSAPTPR